MRPVQHALPVCLALAASFILGCRESDQPAGSRASDPALAAASPGLTVVWTSYLAGQLEPCGCTEARWGGLARRATAIDQLRADAEHLLVLDAGSQTRGPAVWEQINLRYALRGLHSMGGRIANIGVREQLLDPATLRQLGADEQIQWVSLNVLRADGSPIDQQYVVMRAGDLRILVTGVAAALGVERAGDPSGFRTEDPEFAATMFASTLAAIDHDVAILLADLDHRQLRRLAERAPEFDYILGGDVAQPSKSLEQIGPAAVAAVAGKAKVLGVLDLSGQEARLQVVTLDDQFEEAPSLLQLVEEYNSALEAATLEHGAASLGIVSEQAGAGGFNYMGTASCGSCHQAAQDAWGSSRHAHAIETLVDLQREYNPECLRCHTVGLGEPGGFRAVDETPALTDVGCESCHGPGRRHVEIMWSIGQGEQPAEAAAEARMRTVTVQHCETCHDPENSPGFDFETYWPRIEHGLDPPN